MRDARGFTNTDYVIGAALMSILALVVAPIVLLWLRGVFDRIALCILQDVC